ncbi:DsrE family protein [Halopseudomonas pelagia]|uniref:DsrE family protein n=1 Tax=Halopseudomonas pelagia TaxID=553151 RepID=UPI0003A615F4|nr:DsrE family protein [Halopseudomonas pelagia]|tara:strand:- start:85 stop:531 length:447 start_codon:yes stop_codon:yes gene_type:complete
MLKLPKRLLIPAFAALSLTLPVHAENHQNSIDDVMVILSDSSTQTQGMAMVLGNTMADQGANVHVLLCDKAGDLALNAYQGESLKPNDLTPGQMLRRLIKQGASVNVCALYLPNSGYTRTDLLEGVNVATPVDMSAQMLNPSFRVFSF